MESNSELKQYFDEMDGDTNLGCGPKNPLRVETKFDSRNGEPILRVEMQNIPESGGAHMMPGSFKIPDHLSKHGLEYDFEYVDLGESHHQEKGLNLYVELPEDESFE